MAGCRGLLLRNGKATHPSGIQAGRSAQHQARPGIGRAHRAGQGRRAGGNCPLRFDFRGRPRAEDVIPADVGTGRGTQPDAGYAGGGDGCRRQRWRRHDTHQGRTRRGQQLSRDRTGYGAGRTEASAGTEPGLPRQAAIVPAGIPGQARPPPCCRHHRLAWPLLCYCYMPYSGQSNSTRYRASPRATGHVQGSAPAMDLPQTTPAAPDPTAKVGVLLYDAIEVDETLAATVALVRAKGIRVAGLLQRFGATLPNGKRSMWLEDIATGRSIRLDQPRGPGATACVLDP